MGQNRLNPRDCFRLACVDARDMGMGVRTSENFAMEHSRHFHIVNVLCSACDYLNGILAGCWFSYVPVFLGHVRHFPLLAASSTASTTW